MGEITGIMEAISHRRDSRQENTMNATHENDAIGTEYREPAAPGLGASKQDIKAYLDRLEAYNQTLDGWDPAPLHDYSGAQLARQNLSGMHLTNSYFAEADLKGANFTNADLSGSSFSSVKAHGTAFVYTNLTNTGFTAISHDNDFTDAIFAGADMSGALIDNGDYTGADITDANLTGARMRPGLITVTTLGWDNVANGMNDGARNDGAGNDGVGNEGRDGAENDGVGNEGRDEATLAADNAAALASALVSMDQSGLEPATGPER